jgi:hypothetical protein
MGAKLCAAAEARVHDEDPGLVCSGNKVSCALMLVVERVIAESVSVPDYARPMPIPPLRPPLGVAGDPPGPFDDDADSRRLRVLV